MGTIRLSGKLSHSAVGREFSVNESTAKQIQKNEEDVPCSVHEAALERAKV